MDWLEGPERWRVEQERADQARRSADRARMRRAWRIIAVGFVVVIVVPLLILGAIVWRNERAKRARSGEKSAWAASPRMVKSAGLGGQS